jgi:hypothetical protein
VGASVSGVAFAAGVRGVIGASCAGDVQATKPVIKIAMTGITRKIFFTGASLAVTNLPVKYDYYSME